MTKYYTFHVDDSGAIEDSDEKVIKGEQVLMCTMYDDDEFNNLNDIIHSLNDFILNKKALDIITGSNTIKYQIQKAKVLRKEKILGLINKYKSYDYFELTFPDENAVECYDWIDFDKSEIYAIDKLQNRIKLNSHQQKLELIEQNKSNSDERFDFETKQIVFGKNFNLEIDLFTLPLYSWGVYISERLKAKLENAKITDIGFAESKDKLGEVWKPHFPDITYE